MTESAQLGRISENQCLSSTLGICLRIDFISITRNVNLVDILYLGGGVTQKDLKKIFRKIPIKIQFLISRLQKKNSLNLP